MPQRSVSPNRQFAEDSSMLGNLASLTARVGDLKRRRFEHSVRGDGDGVPRNRSNELMTPAASMRWGPLAPAAVRVFLCRKGCSAGGGR